MCSQDGQRKSHFLLLKEGRKKGKKIGGVKKIGGEKKIGGVRKLEGVRRKQIQTRDPIIDFLLEISVPSLSIWP